MINVYSSVHAMIKTNENLRQSGKIHRLGFYLGQINKKSCMHVHCIARKYLAVRIVVYIY